MFCSRNALFRIDPMLLTTSKISLKGILRWLPGAGFAMSTNAFLFLYRQFDKDKARINKLIEYFANSGENYQILLFVEGLIHSSELHVCDLGTDKCPHATGRSKTYAAKQQLVHYDHLLHPRTTGFTHFLTQLRQRNHNDLTESNPTFR